MLKYVTEFIGTFMFLAVILMSGGNPIAIGVALTAAIYFGAHVSGGNYNPAVSVMMFAKGGLSGMTTLGYIVAQLLGGLAALYFYDNTKAHTGVVGFTHALFDKVKHTL